MNKEEAEKLALVMCDVSHSGNFTTVVLSHRESPKYEFAKSKESLNDIEEETAKRKFNEWWEMNQ